MSSADLDTVRTLAGLARLALSDEELARYQGDLARILAAFETLARHEGVTLADPRTCSSPSPEPGRTRADRPLPSLPPEVILAPAPAQEENFFLVPKTVGGER